MRPTTLGGSGITNAPRLLSPHMGRSNWYQVLKPVVHDTGFAGSGGLHVKKGEESLLRFDYIEIGSFYPEENGEKSIRTVWREIKLKPEQMADMFGEENLGPKGKQLLEKQRDGESVQQFTVIHYVSARKKRDSKSICPGTRCLTHPCMCAWRTRSSWSRVDTRTSHLPSSGQRYGRITPLASPPATKAEPAMRELNKLAKNMHKGAALAVDPPWLIPSEMVDEVANYPNGVTIYDERGSGAKPEQQPLRNEFTVGFTLMEKLETQVREFFHSALFESIAAKGQADDCPGGGGIGKCCSPQVPSIVQPDHH